MLEKAFPLLNFTACSRSCSRYPCSYTIKFPRVSAKFSRIPHFSPMQLIPYAPGKRTIQPEVFSTCFLLVEVRESTFQIAIYSFKRSIYFPSVYLSIQFLFLFTHWKYLESGASRRIYLFTKIKKKNLRTNIYLFKSNLQRARIF